MTRLIFVNEELVIVLQEQLPAAMLVEAIQTGFWPLPAALAHFLPAAQRGVPCLRAVSLGRLVIISPLEMAEVASSLPPGIPSFFLSPRQAQVLQCLADGLSTKQIASQLDLHDRTVDMHVAAIKRRFGTRTRMQAVLRGAALGLCKVRSEVKSSGEIGYTRRGGGGLTRRRLTRDNDEKRTIPDSADQ